MRTILSIVILSAVSVACASSKVATDSIVPLVAKDSGTKVVLMSEVKWEQLNPARGDQSPKAGTLWGDRKGSVPTGFLVKFVDGFSSPPHIHNVSYRGVVISGHIHNDDPDAANMWMPTGSFWTQPKGEVHITAAKGSTNVAYIEIEKGPYLVLPTDKAFDGGERPVNVDASNIVWVDVPGAPVATNGPKVAYLWGNSQPGQLNGTLVKLPAGFTGKIQSRASRLRSVVIQGQLQYQMNENNIKTLEPGSYFSSEGEAVHQVSSSVGLGSIIYIRTDGIYDVIPTQVGK